MIMLQELLFNYFMGICVVVDIFLSLSILISFIMFFKEGESLKEIVKVISIPLLPVIAILTLLTFVDVFPTLKKSLTINGVPANKTYSFHPTWDGSYVKITTSLRGKKLYQKNFAINTMKILRIQIVGFW